MVHMWLVMIQVLHIPSVILSTDIIVEVGGRTTCTCVFLYICCKYLRKKMVGVYELILGRLGDRLHFFFLPIFPFFIFLSYLILFSFQF